MTDGLWSDEIKIVLKGYTFYTIKIILVFRHEKCKEKIWQKRKRKIYECKQKQLTASRVARRVLFFLLFLHLFSFTDRTSFFFPSGVIFFCLSIFLCVFLHSLSLSPSFTFSLFSPFLPATYLINLDTIYMFDQNIVSLLKIKICPLITNLGNKTQEEKIWNF